MRLVPLSNVQQFAAINLTSDPGAIGGFVHVPQCAQVTIHWTLTDGKRAHNVLYGRYSGPFAGSVAACNSIKASLVAGATWTALAAHLATGTALAAVTLRDVNPTDGSGVLISSDSAATPGTSSGTALPSEVAAVITKRTAKAGKQNRGRIYVPGWATTALGPIDVIASPAVTALQNWANIIGSAMVTAGYTHVLGQQARAAYVSPITGTSFPARAAQSVDITALVVRDNTWDSQRKRGLK